ncbi:hypothetical protein FB451DRAFT_1272879 [Mycena latifolia]|nr:hypothetical protein FB451DRAFT_1272879 [Mycena latifolia]
MHKLQDVHHPWAYIRGLGSCAMVRLHSLSWWNPDAAFHFSVILLIALIRAAHSRVPNGPPTHRVLHRAFERLGASPWPLPFRPQYTKQTPSPVSALTGVRDLCPRTLSSSTCATLACGTRFLQLMLVHPSLHFASSARIHDMVFSQSIVVIECVPCVSAPRSVSTRNHNVIAVTLQDNEYVSSSYSRTLYIQAVDLYS